MPEVGGDKPAKKKFATYAKEATVKRYHRYHYETHEQIKEHLAQFLAAYNFAKRLKTLRGLTP